MSKLDSFQRKFDFQSPPYPLNQILKFHTKHKQQQFQPDTWVKLKELPNPYSHDEALLLCQASKYEWCVWIPEYGEAILHTSQLCTLSD